MTTPRPMTKSPRRVAREALAVAREALPAYSCPPSRKDFTQHPPRHYARRRGTRYRQRRYVRPAIACHTQALLIAAAEVRVSPTNEPPLFEPLIDEAACHARWDRVLADRAYDAEHNHATARE